MNTLLQDLMEEMALHLHDRHGKDFTFHKGRWWVRLQAEDGNWYWTQDRARDTLVACLRDMMAGMVDPTDLIQAKFARAVRGQWGINQITGAAQARFINWRGLPCPPNPPATVPEPPTPAAGN